MFLDSYTVSHHAGFRNANCRVPAPGPRKVTELLKAGSPAPHFEARLLPGQSLPFWTEKSSAVVSTQDLIVTHPCFCAIVKADCPTCSFALRYFQRLHDLHGQSVPVVLIVQEDEETASWLVNEFDLSLPVLLDEEPYPVGESFELRFVPGCVLISRDGQIEVSFESFEREQFLAIHELLGEVSGCSQDLFQPGEVVAAFQPG